jgi:uncharacterized protein
MRTPMATPNVEIVRAMFAAFERGDEEDLLSFAAPDVEIRPAWDSLSIEPTRGYDGFLEFWQEWPSFWHSYSVEPLEFVEAGEHVVVVLHERARSRPEFAEVEDEFAHVWTIREGKVTAVRVYNQRADALKAVGLKKSS